MPRWSQVGSAADVSLINRSEYENFMNSLYGGMGEWGQGLGGYAGSAGQQFGNLAGYGSQFGNLGTLTIP